MIEVHESKSAPALEIAHVLFMDIVAYSRLPMDEQQRSSTDCRKRCARRRNLRARKPTTN